MTSQQSHNAETYAETALGGDTTCGQMCSHRAAHKTEGSSCILTSQSPPKDIFNESDRSLLVYQTTPVPTKCHLRLPLPKRPHQQTWQEHEGRWGGGEKARKHRYSLSLNSDKLRTILADKTNPLRPEFDNKHRQKRRFRIPHSKRLHDTYSQSFQQPLKHTINTQAGEHNTEWLEMGPCGDNKAGIKWSHIWEWMGLTAVFVGGM